MARSEARLSVSIWTDADFLDLTEGAQRMFMFLLSQPDLTHDGVLALRERRWSKSAKGLTRADVEDRLEELSKARFIVVDEDTEEVLIRSFIRRDKVYRQPNVLRAAADHLAVVSSPVILAAIATELRRVVTSGDLKGESVRIVEEMLAAIGNPSPSPSGKGSQNPSGNPSGGVPGATDECPPNPPANGCQGSGRTVGGAKADASSGIDGDLCRSDVSPDGNPSGNPSGKGSANPSGNPFGNPSAATPGERGVVTAVSSASPFPVPRAPGPRPQSSTGGPRGWTDGDRRRTAEPESAPPTRCAQHRDTHNPPNCGACADVRKAREQWDRDQAAAASWARSEQARQQAAATRAAIDACQLCDQHGQRDGRTCLHDPDMNNRARRGAAAARAAIRRP